ncbi:Short chain dehydrogenase citE [Paramyrothecium foliicola]|nr:Short chain dehydrogenase citE [Paramyrothecium foliicola]
MSLPVLNAYHKESYPYISPSRPELNQSGKTIAVAGASTGIGFAIARAFVVAGAERVILLGRRRDVVASSAARLNQDYGSDVAEGRSLDISNQEDIDKFWSDLQVENIYVDVLVLNAAAFGKGAPILESDLEQTWSDFETNVRGPLGMTLHFYKQTTGSGKKFLVNVSTIAAYMWTTMGPERPTYGLTKNAGTALMQQIAKDTKVSDMQVVSFHPGGVLTESARKSGVDENSGFRFDDENLPGHFAVWAASPEAAFLHGRFVWANWDMEEIKNGVVGQQIQEDEHFLKVGIEGLTEKTGGAIF